MSEFGSRAFAGRPFVVFRAWGRFAEPQYLRLEGPFQYPSWVATPEAATQLPIAAASGWAEALKTGATDRSTRPVPVEDVLEKTPDPTPTWRDEHAEYEKMRAEREAAAKAVDAGWEPPATKREFGGILGIEGMD